MHGITTSIRAAKEGDRQEFDRLVRACTRPIVKVLRAEAGKGIQKRFEIDDLLQETFLRAFRSIADFRGEGGDDFMAWLTGIARHVAKDHARKVLAQKGDVRREVSLERKVQGKDGKSLDILGLLEAQDQSPSRGLRRDERFERLKRALKSLPPDQARVIALARLEGLPIKEVARRMDRSPEATSMLLLRALRKMKALFGTTESIHLPDRSLETGEDHGK
jgi:RNA polymerase sigma-70 factor (ECF subfamily)